MSEDPNTSAPEPSAAEPAKKAGSRRKTFARRLGSTVLLWGMIGVGFWTASPWMFFLIVAGLGLAGLVEYFHLFQDAGRRRFRFQAYTISVGYMVALFAPLFGSDLSWLPHLDGWAIALLIVIIVFSRLWHPLEGLRTLDEILTAVFGFVYITILFGFIARIFDMSQLTDADGNSVAHFYVLYLIAVTKFTDMGAYAIGSLIGKHKMVPHVSPGKTWQGFGGAIFGAFVASFGCLGLFGDKISLITPVHATVLALVLSLMAVLGDLAESILKRSAEAKDSGHKLPGIGGVLDLIDSVLFTAPVLYFYLVMVLS